MSTATCIDFNPFTPPPSTFGVSDTALKIHSIFKNALICFYEPMTVARRTEDSYDLLLDIFSECNFPEWDGYNALAVKLNSITEAMKLIQVLPRWVNTPNIIPTPKGGIGFEWRKGSRNYVLLTVNGNNEINYAIINGINKSHGIEFFGEALPKKLLAELLVFS